MSKPQPPTKSKKTGRENDSVIIESEAIVNEVARREEVIQQYWQTEDIFARSVTHPAGKEPKGDYVFYDGPPFATGLPHYGHILAGTIKDAVPRFWTMNGYRVRRRWGWDCHGLPLENLIEKKLGLATKRDIEAYGVKNFNEAARSAVMEYADDWKKVVPRMGRFVDMDDDYRTMDSTYTESVWWGFAELYKKGYVYEGFKSMHLCPRCGTTLSNFEVNQGYKDIKDIAVTIKLPLLDKAGEATSVSLLVWTTTPWTLPGNTAAAIHQDFTYVQVAVETGDGTEHVILAKERLAHLGDLPYQIEREFLGSELVGRAYEPPFPYLSEQLADTAGLEKAFRIYHADYVELGEEGTGGVHLAPAYGEEDLELAQREGVPVQHHVDVDGHFYPWVTEFAGLLVKPKDDESANISHLDTDIQILKALTAAGKLFKKENITHSYPHCWRCDTPLLNYATTSWFVSVTDFKEQLVAENKKINWVPEYVGSNRFGRWLEGARDWAVSRQRYWGAPLPIWKHPDTGAVLVISSLQDLKKHTKSNGNQFWLMRHGQAESNIKGTISADPAGNNPLTAVGKEQVAEVAAGFIKQGVTFDLIIHSGFMRTKDTAEIMAEKLGLEAGQVLVDERLSEVQAGSELEGCSWQSYADKFTSRLDSYREEVAGVENRRDLQRRAGELLYDLENKYHGQKILLVSHLSTIQALEDVAAGRDPEAAVVNSVKEEAYYDNAVTRPLDFTPLPHNDDYILDYHRPYIDEVVIVDEAGVEMQRVPDVFDCWFESGSMSFAQHHYPFAHQDDFLTEYYPAQFISESMDQTRGWFYSMLVLGTALFDKSPYQNVVVGGLVLAEDGKKMSKSLQNYPDPMELVDRQGADALRFYLLSSPLMRGEDLNFSEKEVAEIQRKNIGRLHNVLLMYQTYTPGAEIRGAYRPTDALDQWWLARIAQTINEVTKSYQRYELDKATRPLADLIDDLSVWYLRRSRDRLKSDQTEVQAAAATTLRFSLRQLALLMAPVMPFYAEYLWQAVRYREDGQSVHLAGWPAVAENYDEDILNMMESARRLVTEALQVRTKVGLKVRQPLAKMIVNQPLSSALAAVVAEEVNVQEVLVDLTQADNVVLDTVLTPELIAAGAVRELIRAIQDLRKQRGLEPKDVVTVNIFTDELGGELVTAAATEIKRVVGASDLRLVSNAVEVGTDNTVLKTSDYEFNLALQP